MRGKRTSPEKTEEIKALSIIYDSKIISEKLNIPLRTVQSIIARKDNPVIEAKREEKRLEIVDKVFSETQEEIEAEVNDLISIGTKARKRLHQLLDEGKTKAIETTAVMDRSFQQRRLLEGNSSVNIAQKLVFQVIHHDGRVTTTGEGKESHEESDGKELSE
jgi:hypothetical protein